MSGEPPGSAPPGSVPSDRPRGSRFAFVLGHLWLRLRGWRVVGPAPSFPKFVFIAAPHTSNWDVPFMLAAAGAMGLRISWLGKDSLFRFPLGTLARAAGAIPVDRSRRNDLVRQVASLFESRQGLILAISPEGTRDHVEHWKSGFYQIALQANVPIGLGYLDYRTRTCGFRGSLLPTGEVRADMDKIREAYRGITGLYGENYCEPRLRDESGTPPPTAGSSTTSPPHRTA